MITVSTGARRALDQALKTARLIVVQIPPGLDFEHVVQEWLAGLDAETLTVEPGERSTAAALEQLVDQRLSQHRSASPPVLVAMAKPMDWPLAAIALVDERLRHHNARAVVVSTSTGRVDPGAGRIVLGPADLVMTAEDIAQRLGTDTPEVVDPVAAATAGWPGLVEGARLQLALRHENVRMVDVTVHAGVRERLRHALMPWLSDSWRPTIDYLAVAGQVTETELTALGGGARDALAALCHFDLVRFDSSDSNGGVGTFSLPGLSTLVVDELRADRENLVRIRRLVADHRFRTGELDGGLAAAFALRDWQRCARISDRWWTQLAFGGHGAVSDQVLAALPSDVLTAFPRAGLRAEMYGVLPVGTIDVDVPTSPRDIQQTLRSPEAVTRALHISMLAVAGRRTTGQQQQAARAIALEAAPFARAAAARGGHGAGGFSTFWNLQAAMACQAAGDDASARTFYQMGRTDLERSDLEFAGPDLAAKSAVFYALRGESDLAATALAGLVGRDPVVPAWIDASIELSRRAAQRIVDLDTGVAWDPAWEMSLVSDPYARDENWIFALWAAARVMMGRGRAKEGLELVGDVVRAHPSYDVSDGIHQSLVAAMRADLHLAAGQGTSARAVLSAVDDDDSITAAARARVMLLTGEAPMVLREFVQSAMSRRGATPRSRRELALVLAAVHCVEGDREQALEAVGQAIADARQHDDRRLATMLSTKALRRIVTDIPEASEVWGITVGDVEAVFPDEVDYVDFSERELVILGELGSSKTFEEIAAEHFVSRHTVKSQAHSVYRKLGVTTRSEAVAAAARLGVLEEPGKR